MYCIPQCHLNHHMHVNGCGSVSVGVYRNCVDVRQKRTPKFLPPNKYFEAFEAKHSSRLIQMVSDGTVSSVCDISVVSSMPYSLWDSKYRSKRFKPPLKVRRLPSFKTSQHHPSCCKSHPIGIISTSHHNYYLCQWRLRQVP